MLILAVAVVLWMAISLLVVGCCVSAARGDGLRPERAARGSEGAAAVSTKRRGLGSARLSG